jgi:nitrite reductase/ring-hydroxylating ferredoxin subunit
MWRGGTIKLVEVGGHQVALANVDGTVYAVDNECPHRGGWLGEGEMNPDRGEWAIECPLHGSVFDVRGGEVLNPPASGLDTLATEAVVFEKSAGCLYRRPDASARRGPFIHSDGPAVDPSTSTKERSGGRRQSMRPRTARCLVLAGSVLGDLQTGYVVLRNRGGAVGVGERGGTGIPGIDRAGGAVGVEYRASG